ncbi:MAG: hypothetical protein RLY93_01975 [Sumerlaeia bacterium]
MASPSERQLIQLQIEHLFDQMIEQQRKKVAKVARRIRPNLSDDDLRDPHSHPEINASPHWNWEDGLLAGLIAGQTAVIRELQDTARKTTSNPDDEEATHLKRPTTDSNETNRP